MSKAQVLEDIFEVLEKDPDGKKFDKGAPTAKANMRASAAAAAAAARRSLSGLPTDWM